MSLFHGAGRSCTSPGMIKQDGEEDGDCAGGVAHDGADAHGDDPDEHHVDRTTEHRPQHARVGDRHAGVLGGQEWPGR